MPARYDPEVDNWWGIMLTELGILDPFREEVSFLGFFSKDEDLSKANNRPLKERLLLSHEGARRFGICFVLGCFEHWKCL